MIQINNIVFVQLPDGAYDFRVYKKLQFFNKPLAIGLPSVGESVDLPPGKWEIIGETKSLTEDKACKLFDDYPSDKSITQYSRLELFNVFMENNQVDTKHNYLILFNPSNTKSNE